MRTCPILFSLLLATPGLAQSDGGTGPVTGLPLDDPMVARILEEADSNSQVMQHLDELVNGIGPRLTSSTNLTEACEWAAQRFREFGLQNVRLEEWGTFPVGFDRGLQRGRLVQPVKRQLRFGTSAWSAGTDGPVRGRVLFAPGNDEGLAAAEGQFGGAWVLMRGARPRFDSDQDDFQSRLGHFLDAEGIAGVIQPTRTELVLTSGNSRVDFDNLPHRVRINLQREDAQLIGALLEEGKEVEAEFEIQNRFVQGPIPLFNVIAEIPGTEKPGELVVFGGHIDSWDGATGTCDNGTGCATTLEAARILGKLGVRPRRTIRFMLWSGEEQGLLGSRAYIQQHPEENDRISAVIVHDGGTNYLSGILATEAMGPILEEAFAPIAAMAAAAEGEEKPFSIQVREGLPMGIGSDHDSYLRSGVPGFFWRQSGRANYNYVHHTQHDVYEEAIEEYERHSAKVIAIAAWRLANLPEMLPRENLVAPRRPVQPSRRLGVYLEEDGLTVSQIVGDSLASKAGLKAKDRLLKIDDRELEGQQDLMQALRGGGDRKKVVVRRGEQVLVFWFDWKEGTAALAEGAG